MRQSFKLSEVELKQHKRLIKAPFPGEAWRFWKRVAAARGVDHGSIISRGEYFTALPIGHGKAWCFPIPLKCSKKPKYEEA